MISNGFLTYRQHEDRGGREKSEFGEGLTVIRLGEFPSRVHLHEIEASGFTAILKHRNCIAMEQHEYLHEHVVDALEGLLRAALFDARTAVREFQLHATRRTGRSFMARQLAPNLELSRSFLAGSESATVSPTSPLFVGAKRF